MPSIRLTTQIAASPAACFEMSLSVDAHTASMEDSGERAIAGVTSGVMRAGDTVTWRARHFGVPITMTSRISEYESPYRFVDEQAAGPFRRWWHEHRFEPSDGGTQMTDVVEFKSPFGPVGSVVNGLFLTRYMTKLLLERNEWLQSALEREAVLVKDRERLSFWADRVRTFTATKTIDWETGPSKVIRRSKLTRRLYIDPDDEPTSHVERLRAATPDERHEWHRVDPLVSDVDRWPTFQALAEACGDDAIAVIEIPYRRVPPSDWEWADDDLEVREFPAEMTWEEVVESHNEASDPFGGDPFFSIDRMLVTGSSGSWCLIYTEIPDVESWVTTAESAPQVARDLLLQATAQ